LNFLLIYYYPIIISEAPIIFSFPKQGKVIYEVHLQSRDVQRDLSTPI